MNTYISYEQLDELIRFAQDDRYAVDLNAVQALGALNATVQANLVKHLAGARKRNAMLAERLDRRKEERVLRRAAGRFEESGLDSAEVANALVYQLQALKTYKLSVYKVMAILYEMYASWLYSKGERLFVEHPVATEYGPRFWHAYKRIDTRTPVTREAWNAFAAARPDIAAFCKNAALKYYDISEGGLRAGFMNTKAFENARPENNNGKWNKEIEDADIFMWKDNQSRKSKSAKTGSL